MGGGLNFMTPPPVSTPMFQIFAEFGWNFFLELTSKPILFHSFFSFDTMFLHFGGATTSLGGAKPPPGYLIIVPNSNPTIKQLRLEPSTSFHRQVLKSNCLLIFSGSLKLWSYPINWYAPFSASDSVTSCHLLLLWIIFKRFTSLYSLQFLHYLRHLP